MKLQIAVSEASLIFQKRFPDAVSTFDQSRWLSGRASASGSGGRGFDPRPRHTKGVKNDTGGYLAWCSAL